ncbi:PiggyBac transposable element-derived protein 4-like [Plakobranchus ocellatus]|uniref:PiggyBac transposable element-derived protein 4-like n=1 Tax=Plakobranchus ocellatus TaxID=259542 RepID=A0AAV3Z1U7_9GAST|nr:PiggyBac transposable element-derived protein 4-like [Plakobranchus ocellatus]
MDLEVETVQADYLEPESQSSELGEWTSNELSASGRSIFSELLSASGDSDSDVELEEEEFTPERSKNVRPVYHQPLSADINDDEQVEASSSSSSSSSFSPLWREGLIAPDQVAFSFSGSAGLRVKMEDTTPFDFLKLMVDEKMIAYLVRETNRYAAEALSKKKLTAQSRFHRWVDVTIPEMWAFLGLVIAMGLIVIETLDDYWSMDELYSLPFFRSVMAKDRFGLILSFFHIANNKDQLPQEDPKHDPIFKIRPFVDKLMINFRNAFAPGKNIVIDEAMVAWRGPLAFQVHSPNTSDKYGIKLFELCDGKTGYCCNLEFYTGKTQSSSRGPTFDVVNRLISPYLGCGRVLYVDSYYTSPDLFRYLKEHKTLACGTMRRDAKNAPPKNMLPKLSKGEQSITTLTDGHVNYFHVKDKKELHILTTAHSANLIMSGKNDPDTQEPIVEFQAVHDYNKLMGSVDRTDLIVSFNAFKRRTLKWWKKVFFHLFMLAVLNAFLVYKTTAVGKLSQKMFRRDLAKQLVQLLPGALVIRQPSLSVGESSLFRLTARHFPRLVLPKPGLKRQNPQRTCAVCSTPSLRKHSRYECSSCNVGLHIPCFEIYHTCKDFKPGQKPG